MNAEHALLCQMVDKAEVYYASRLLPEHFTPGPARSLYTAVSELYGKHRSVDAYMLKDTLTDTVYGWYREHVSGAVPTVATWAYYRDAVLSEYRKRRVLQIVEEAKARIGDEQIGDWMMREIARIHDTSGADLCEQREFIAEYVQAVEDRYKNRGKTRSIETGFMKLDHYIHGLQKRRLVIIGARPSGGKTALMTSMAANIARAGYGVGIVSVESSRHELTERIVANIGGIDNGHLTTGYLTPADMQSLSAAAERVAEKDWNVVISDNPYLTIDGVKARVREMVMSRGCEVVFVDYVQRIRQRDKSQQFRLHIAECSMELKSLSVELDVPIVALAQLGRDAQDAKPQLSHFKESGQLEQDADVAILIGKDDNGIVLDVAKNRDGKKGVVAVTFDGAHMRFSGGRDDEVVS